jgi:hypothetical protein
MNWLTFSRTPDSLHCSVISIALVMQAVNGVAMFSARSRYASYPCPIATVRQKMTDWHPCIGELGACAISNFSGFHSSTARQEVSIRRAASLAGFEQARHQYFTATLLRSSQPEPETALRSEFPRSSNRSCRAAPATAGGASPICRNSSVGRPGFGENDLRLVGQTVWPLYLLA